MNRWSGGNRSQGAALVVRVIDHPAFVPACLLLAAALRLGLVFAVDNRPVADAEWYYARATELAEGRGYAQPRLVGTADGAEWVRTPTAYWPVGYPAFLGGVFALFGASPLVGKLANVAIGLAVLLLMHWLARTLSGSERVARVTLAALALHPNQIAYSALLYAEPLFLLLILAGIAALMKARGPATWGWACLAGGVFGAASLVKPQALLVPACLVGWVLARDWLGNRPARPRFGPTMTLALVVHAGLALAIAPWVARNHRLFDRHVISNNGGWNLLLGNHSNASGRYMDELGTSFPDIPDPPQNEALSDIAAGDAAFRFMREHPIEAVALLLRKLAHLYIKDVEGFYWIGEGLAEKRMATERAVFAAKVVAQTYYGIVLVLFVTWMFSMFAHRKWLGTFQAFPEQSLGLLLITYFTLVYLPFFGESRFHFPAVPWMIFYAAVYCEERLRLWTVCAPDAVMRLAG
jgi:hypothetical protein